MGALIFGDQLFNPRTEKGGDYLKRFLSLLFIERRMIDEDEDSTAAG
jgi:hypothetical protein